MALQKISQLNSITGAQITASSDVLAVVNNNETKKITVSGLHSGSFSGSFQGDGSGITGVTGEWDGSHLGDASITGSFTVSGSNSSVNFLGAESGVSGSFSGSFQGNSSGSFSGSYVGDGSQLTGVTSEWDGTLNGEPLSGMVLIMGMHK